ncbi:MAG: RNA 2',3'-cyclic phosphodiesterase [Elusimicrobia bacterium CG03_land_8_20_14_0_80_50_18]|nr:MAG: RNA 2',3'-cyclic phosphodiesterase [Elusimicrobia bacterium CG03_land_8_20_14_0_80_50_18]PIX15475.1 MAG: RNA 2',3'-cyclic phosphodiesterase [Elusimicrobia bacterium CG_4_8_14_3_um_filter_50_9]
MTKPTQELNETPVRYFIAVKLSDDAKKEIRNVFGPLLGNIDGRAVPDEGLHLTLKFLGGLSEEKIESAKKIVSEAAAEFSSFRVSLGKTGSFPARKPKVLWAGVRKGREELAALSKFVSLRAKESLGIPKDSKEFIPHITLCRLSSKRAPKDFYSLRFISSFTAEKLFLIRSELHLSGARYRDIFAAKFPNSRGEASQ